MRLLFAIPMFCLGLVAVTAVAEPEKDTDAANFTRTKKLKAKVTVDMTNEPLKEILKEIAGQLEDQKLVGLSTTFAIGVSQNSRMTLKVKDVTVEEALDILLKQGDLGYIVVSNKKSRYDGWLEIRKSKERGYPMGEEPTPKDKAKTPSKGKS